MRAPTTSWWWNDTPFEPIERVFGLPTSWSSAAIRTMSSGRVLATTAIVWASTSLWRWIGSCSTRMAGSSGSTTSAMPVSTRNHRPALGSSTTSSLPSSSRTRSADTISSRSTSCRDRGDQVVVGRQAVAGEEPGRPQHPQRVVGEGHLGRQRRAQHAGGQVGHAAERVDELGHLALGAGDAQRHGVDREVAPRQVGLDLVGEGHVRLAGVGGVGLGPVGGDLEDRVALLQARRCRTGRPGPTPRRPSPLTSSVVRSGRASVVRSMSPARGPAEHEVADDAADEVEALPGRVEALRQRAHLVEDRAQALGDHRARVGGPRRRSEPDRRA